MKKVIGHDQAKKKLTSNLSVQSWLICGKKGIGKATLAKSFSNWFLMKNSRPLSKLVYGEKSLGEAQMSTTEYLNVFEERKQTSTTKLPSEIEFWEQSYDEVALDLHIVEGDTIGVEKVREMKNSLYLSPMQSEYKIAIVDSLEAMTNNAKNAILKILEEPPKNSKIFIISHKPYDIQTTIQCRCFQLNLLPLTYDETKQVVSSQYKFGDQTFDTLFPGMPGMIINAISSDAYESYKCFYKFLHNLKNPDMINKVINSEIELELASHMIQAFILESIKREVNNVEILLSQWKRIDELFVAARQLYLDKKHVLANAVNIIASVYEV
ncbi:DNA polymerase III subunit delta' [Wolbachia endosymbiont of Cantharis cryptica]|uniref:DNA polymerase III subunit delta' n=1 Tax=Wolbachia endosymbiont of Cantharis cryptica TaxID=3066132 RepID=UPI00376F1B09